MAWPWRVEMDDIGMVVCMIDDDIGKRMPTTYIDDDDISNVILYRNNMR